MRVAEVDAYARVGSQFGMPCHFIALVIGQALAQRRTDGIELGCEAAPMPRQQSYLPCASSTRRLVRSTSAPTEDLLPAPFRGSPRAGLEESETYTRELLVTCRFGPGRVASSSATIPSRARITDKNSVVNPSRLPAVSARHSFPGVPGSLLRSTPTFLRAASSVCAFWLMSFGLIFMVSAVFCVTAGRNPTLQKYTPWRHECSGQVAWKMAAVLAHLHVAANRIGQLAAICKTLSKTTIRDA
jgi:hypothetical protein